MHPVEHFKMVDLSVTWGIHALLCFHWASLKCTLARLKHCMTAEQPLSNTANVGLVWNRPAGSYSYAIITSALTSAWKGHPWISYTLKSLPSQQKKIWLLNLPKLIGFYLPTCYAALNARAKPGPSFQSRSSPIWCVPRVHSSKNCLVSIWESQATTEAPEFPDLATFCTNLLEEVIGMGLGHEMGGNHLQLGDVCHRVMWLSSIFLLRKKWCQKKTVLENFGCL